MAIIIVKQKIYYENVAISNISVTIMLFLGFASVCSFLKGVTAFATGKKVWFNIANNTYLLY